MSYSASVPQVVPLGRELPLRGPRLVEVQRVVDGHRHELRDLAQEGDVLSAIRDRLTAAEAERTDPPACGLQWQNAEADDAALLELCHGMGPPVLGRCIGDDERLLSLDNPPGGNVVDRIPGKGRESRAGCLENPGARDAAIRVHKTEAQSVEAYDTLQVDG